MNLPTELLNKEGLKKILEWCQDNKTNMHPLTCAKCSEKMFVPDDDIVLKCPKCDYVQDWIPISAVELYLDKDETREKLRKWGVHTEK